ncbi:MAG: alpha-1,2-fucosyltransferase [Bacteroides sp.]|nr:alpha-1,2-fucosyltransferase [Bacteroides sp.]
MKIVKILGGLGNQMFQYALFIALKEHFPNEKVLTDTSYFKTYHVHNGLELERVFGLTLPQASFSELVRLTYPVKWFKLSRAIRKILPKRKTECIEAKDYTFNAEVFTSQSRYYDGYWQNFEYFKPYIPILKEKFTFHLPVNSESRQLLEELNRCKHSVSIHIRRGDYLKAPNYAGLCGIDYYTKAIEYIKSMVKSPEFYIFSDDISWCKENISPILDGLPHKFVDWNIASDSPLDMLLMSNCHHNILANSSFSWWSACLNSHSDKIVCAPKKWTNTKVNCKFQMPDWILF